MIVAHTLTLLAGLAFSLPPRPAGGPVDACDKLSPAPAGAETKAAGWNGLFQLDRAESDDLEQVAERALSQLGRRARRRAGGKLQERLKADECLRIAEDSAAITIESERGVLWKVNRDGTAQPGPARAGAGRTLAATVTDSIIAITGSGDRGEGRYELRRSAPGDRLELAVSLSAQRLESPIAYRLVYRPRARASSPE